MKGRMGIIWVMILLGCITAPAMNDNVLINPNEVSTPKNIHAHRLFERYAQEKGISTAETQEFFEEKYGIEKEEEIFSHLPTISREQMEQIYALEKGNTQELNTIPREVYIQPEFYPTFQTQGINEWILAPEEPAYKTGVAATPAEQEGTITKGETSFQTTLFVNSAWGVNNYQATGFRYTIEPQTDLGIVFIPQTIVLGPNFPVFTSNWAKKVTVQGFFSGEPQPGTYIIHIYPDNPDEKKLDEYQEEYGTLVNANSGFLNSEGYATIVVHVE